MKYSGLILAAGSGTRISDKINIPKCLIEINNKTILEYQLESFKHAGIKNIYIVTGFQDNKIKNFLKKSKFNLNIKLIQNKIFSTTNNMYSASLAKKFLFDKDFILCNGDVVIEKKIIRKLINGKNINEILVDKYFYDEESMKIKTNSSNHIINISKKIYDKKSSTSIDFYKFSKLASIKLFQTIDNHIKLFGEKDWTEVAIKKILKKQNFFPNYIDNLKWCEIDTFKDLLFAENKFKEIKKKIFNDYQNFIVDIDGTTFQKKDPIAGTEIFLKNIKKYNKQIVFLSNNSSLGYESFNQLFKKVNFKISKSNIINSTNVLVKYLKEKKIKKIYVTGNKKFILELKKNKIIISENNPELLVISYDDEINYKKLQKFCELLNKDIPMVATHSDNFYPGKNGPIPDAGSIISLIKTTTNKSPKIIFGKPSKLIKKLLKVRGKTIVIGDKLNKDIQFAENCGYDSALIFSENELMKLNDKKNNKIKTDFILSSIRDLA